MYGEGPNDTVREVSIMGVYFFAAVAALAETFSVALRTGCVVGLADFVLTVTPWWVWAGSVLPALAAACFISDWPLGVRLSSRTFSGSDKSLPESTGGEVTISDLRKFAISFVVGFLLLLPAFAYGASVEAWGHLIGQ